MTDWSKVPPPGEPVDWNKVQGPPSQEPLPPSATAYTSSGVQPEAASTALDLSKKTGLDPQWVKDNYDTVKNEHEMASFSQELGARPLLKQYADRSPMHAAAVRPNAGPLGRLEGWFSGMGDALKMGFADIGYAESAREYMGSGGPLGGPATFLGIEQEIQKYDSSEHSFMEGVARAVPQTALYVAAGLIPLPGTLPGLLYLQNKGVLARRIQQASFQLPAKDGDPEGLTPEQVDNWATGGSAAVALTVAGLLNPLVRSIPGAKEGLSKVTAAVLARAASYPLAVRLLGAAAMHTVTGAFGMALQGAINTGTVEKATKETVDWGKIGTDTWDDFKKVLPLTAALGVPFLLARGRVHTADTERAQLDAEVREAENVNLPPDQKREVIDHLAQGQRVYISGEGAKTVQERLRPEDVAEAELSDGTVSVSRGEYLTDLADQHEKLRDDVKLSQNGATPREALEMREALSPEDAKKLYGAQPPDDQQGLNMPLAGEMSKKLASQLEGSEKPTTPTKSERTPETERFKTPGETALAAVPREPGATAVSPPLHEVMAQEFGGTPEEWAKKLTPELMEKLTSRELKMDDPATADHAARAIDRLPISEIQPNVFRRLADAASRRIAKAAEETISGQAAGVRAPGENKAIGQMVRLADTERARDLNLAKEKRATEVQTEMQKGFDKLAAQSQDQKLRAKLGLAGQPLLHLFDALTEGTRASKTRQGWVSAHNEAVQNGATPFSEEATQFADERMAGALEESNKWFDDNARPVQFDLPALRAFMAKPKAWTEMTPPEARNLQDAIKQLTVVAEDMQEVRSGDRKAGLAEVTEAARREAKVADTSPVLYSSGNPKPLAVRMRDVGSDMLAKLLQFKTSVEDLGATAKSVLYDKMRESMFNRDALAKEAGKFYKDNFEKMPAEIRKRATEDTDLSQDLPMRPGVAPLSAVPRTYLYLLHLNNGSHGNMDRVLGGAPGWTQEAVNRVLYEDPRTRLTKPELDFLQSMHDFNDQKLWPLAKAKMERLTGLASPKVSGVERTVEFEDGTKATYSGGYWPLCEDRSLSPADTTVGGVKDFQGNKYQPSSIYNPAMRERAATAKYPVSFDWSVVPAHISQMVHDLTMDEWVRDASKLINYPDFKALSVQKLGQGRSDELALQVKRIATRQADSVGQEAGLPFRMLQYIRGTAIMGVVGDSLPMALGQLSHIPGMFIGGKVSILHGAPALLSILKPVGFDADGAHFFPNWKAAVDESKVLQNREQTWTAFTQDIDRLTTTRSPMEVVRGQAGIFLHWVDRYLSTWAYTAAKNTALARNASEAESMRYANGLVEDIMPTHGPETAAPLLTNRAIGATLMMHGFGSTLLNLGYKSVLRPVSDAWASGNRGEAVKLAAIRGGQYMAMLSVLSVAGQYLFGRGPEEDESAGAWAARNAIAGWFYPFPWAGGAGQFLGDQAVKALGRAGVFDQYHEGAVKFSPVGAPATYLMQKGYELAGKLANENREPEDKFFDALEAALAAARLPSRPVRSVHYVYDLLTNRTYARGPADVVHGATYGEREVGGEPVGPEAGPRDPFNSLQDILSGRH